MPPDFAERGIFEDVSAGWCWFLIHVDTCVSLFGEGNLKHYNQGVEWGQILPHRVNPGIRIDPR
jgi:hypothetical protein